MIYYKHLASFHHWLPYVSPTSIHQESEVSNPNIDDEVQGQLRMTVQHWAWRLSCCIVTPNSWDFEKPSKRKLAKGTDEMQIFAQIHRRGVYIYLYVQIMIYIIYKLQMYSCTFTWILHRKFNQFKQILKTPIKADFNYHQLAVVGSFACYMTIRFNTNQANETPSTTFYRFLMNPGPTPVDPNHRQHLSEIETHMSVAATELGRWILGWPMYQKARWTNTKITQTMSESLWCVECTVGGHIMSYPVRTVKPPIRCYHPNGDSNANSHCPTENTSNNCWMFYDFPLYD